MQVRVLSATPSLWVGESSCSISLVRLWVARKGPVEGVRGSADPLSVLLKQDTGQEPENQELRPEHSTIDLSSKLRYHPVRGWRCGIKSAGPTNLPC
jgi:hypothetical protein